MTRTTESAISQAFSSFHRR